MGIFDKLFDITKKITGFQEGNKEQVNYLKQSDGLWTYRHDNGEIKEVGNVKNGKREGIRL